MRLIGAALAAATLLAPLQPASVLAATGYTRRENLAIEAKKPLPKGIPFSDVGDGPLSFGKAAEASEIATARRKIAALKPYMDEIERYIFTNDYEPLRAFLNVFSQQEDSFVKTIDGVASRGTADAIAAAEAMEHEAKQLFLALDEIRKAATLEKPSGLKKGYIKLALAYDRYLKASDNLPGYDKIVSTEKYFANIPDEWLVFDTEKKPEPQDPVIFIEGPDKGRTGVLLGYITPAKNLAAKSLEMVESKASGIPGFPRPKGDGTASKRKAVIKMDNYLEEPQPGQQVLNEVKEVPCNFVARQLES